MTSLSKIEFGLADLKSKYQQAKGQYDLLQKQKANKEQEYSQIKTDIEVWQQVQILFGKVSEFAREQLKLRIEETCTAALQAIFCTDDISFVIEMNTIGGKPAANWSVVSKYGESVVAANPEDARGGGVTDVVSLALRLALLELARPKLDGPVILDEPGKMISREYLPNVAAFLKSYAKKTGRQIIMVTHHEVLAEVADISYRITQTNGISEVTRNEVYSNR